MQDIYSSTPLVSSIIPATSLSEASYSYSTIDSHAGLNILLQPPTSDEISQYFALINPLKYSQPHQPLPSPFSPPLNGLTITAYNAGHTLGGTIWHVQHGMESVVYAVDWNQVRENVLTGAAWLGASSSGGAEVIEQLRKPTALICSTKGVEQTASAGGRVKRDELLLDMIRTTVTRGGTVLIPTDSSARVLELAYVLDHAWQRETQNSGHNVLSTARLYLASKNAGATMRYASSMIEWMDENVVREFEAEAAKSGNNNKQHRRTDSKQMRRDQDNARPTGRDSTPADMFEFRYLKLLERKSQLEKILLKKIPKVILASDTSLTWGFSREALQRLAADPANLVILTERSHPNDDCIPENEQDVGRLLWKWYAERKDGVAIETSSGGQTIEQVYTDSRDLRFVDPYRKPLEGKELVIYQQYQATKRQLRTSLQSGGGAMLESAADAIEETSSSISSSSEESDSERQGKALNMSAAVAQARNKLSGNKEVTGANILLRQPGVYDYDVRGKKGRDAIFPYVTKRRRLDDFGELIRPEDYLRAEERDDVDGQDMRDTDGGKQNKLGQKRKWEDPSLSNINGHRQSIGSKKRRKIGESDTRPLNGTREQNGMENIDSESSDGSDSDVEESLFGPAKILYKDSSVQANLRIAYVDFAGLHDQRSLSMLIPLIQPRKLVLVGGSKSETSWLAEECRQKLRSRSTSGDEGIMDGIYSPVNDETVSASMDTNAWTVKLSDALVRRLHWQDVRGLGVVTLMGRLGVSKPIEHEVDTSRRKRQRTVKDEEDVSNLEDPPSKTKTVSELPPILDVIPASMQAATRSIAQPLHVGDLRLADLRKILQSTGHSAEFRGEGTLLIDDFVAVRKSTTGQIEVESGGSRISDLMARDKEESFQAVKRRIYEGLAIIVGG